MAGYGYEYDTSTSYTRRAAYAFDPYGEDMDSNAQQIKHTNFDNSNDEGYYYDNYTHDSRRGNHTTYGREYIDHSSRHTPPPHVRHHSTRSRSPKSPTYTRPRYTLSPPPAPVPTSPSQSYLSTSLLPSSSLPPAKAPRKLLILDLNGTLLVRAAHARADQPPQKRGQKPTPKLRAVYRRPYMATFAEFLRCPETKGWLDTMVWSSAQPHSVEDMVDVCFPPTDEEGTLGNGSLVAVWARDTLGLSQELYHQKTSTSKNLEKVWTGLRLPGSTSFHGPSSPRSRSPSPSPSAPTIKHSAETTVLLDDSPAKATLQPWNHVCIKEYEHEMRVHDLESLRRHKARELVERYRAEQQQAGGVVAEQQDGVDQNEAEEEEVEMELLDKQSSSSSPPPQEAATTEDKDTNDAATNKRLAKKRRKKAHAAKLAYEQAVRDVALLEEQAKNGQEEEEYDATLLAVIGVLDVVRVESNVAGWLRGRGLWRWPGCAEGDSGMDEAESTSTEGGEEAEAKVKTEMWFEDPKVVRGWAKRGREVLERLGIEVVAGVKAD